MGIFRDSYGDPNPAGILFGGVLAIGVTVGGCLGTCAITDRWHYSEGDRTGMVNKISRKGTFWETWEGQMALEGITSDGKTMGANVWDFAIDNYLPRDKQNEMAKKIEGYMNSGQKVIVHYKEPLKTPPWRSGSDCLIQSIEPIGGMKANEAKVIMGRGNVEYVPNEAAITLEGRHYLLRHDSNGVLRATELFEKSR